MIDYMFVFGLGVGIILGLLSSIAIGGLTDRWLGTK
jgi:hypothetical protein